MSGLSLGLEQSLRLTLQAIRPLGQESVSLEDSVGRVAAAEPRARVDSPSQATSRKDGYAVQSHDVARATPGQPVRLRLAGTIAAGDQAELAVEPGGAVRVLTGAVIPPGADAVVSEEFTRADGPDVFVETFADTAKNILSAGGDVTRGQAVLAPGRVITPVIAGLLAAAGLDAVSVHARPRVGILATGNEIVAPGRPLGVGQLYASNLVTLAGFCRSYGMIPHSDIAADDPAAMGAALEGLLARDDALVTSGGAWRGDHDLTASVLEGLGWQKVFHRIRMGPGKAVGFGLLQGKPVFLLPGGPPSNLMGFLQIALPGLLALAGRGEPGLPRIRARLAEELGGGHRDWTDFFQGVLSPGEDLPWFHPLPKRSRLSALATATAIAAIPEGRERLARGAVIQVQLLTGELAA
ncbi:MAG: molybdopterin molybdotransferase MoeA [Desulfarculaceae bacterium]|nr:molybdopterin molybdotransferase MoeA [Desulfarculaceae bacterium]MCF8074320.1 molybdopterin molybdotransferase MoeA [Desulfarculaceae bacterium]MCF8103388.1 molybdopterin molybdotransferase MoeA [Desulfarculaceae bacterium]MCF8117757.1 molybdopterin molybdotransferase MoeA [Desulfarculaceae bacterium]